MSERVFTYAAPGLKFGSGASSEIGYDLQQYGASRVLLVTDPGVTATGHPARIADQLAARGLDVTTYDQVHVEPTDESIAHAIAFARDAAAFGAKPFDAVVAVGGGSAIDTAKAVDLLLTNDGELMDYVNAPVGAGRAPEHPLLPLVAVPTTTGTGSESTTICVLDVLALKVKTGISHARLRPTLAVVDPELTFSQPAMVTASCGMDILCHALESWTARWYAEFEAKKPEQRVPYCGANPIADVWAEKALTLLAGSFRAAVRDGSDRVAREQMALAATFAGLGFGNAGVHVPHACAYPIAGLVHQVASHGRLDDGYRPEGYPADEPMVPHGMAVVMTAPAAFALTFEASPERHLRAAELLGAGFEARSARTSTTEAEALPEVLRRLMREVGLPSGLAEIGYGEADVDALVEGALKQQRLLATAPVEVTGEDLAGVFRASMEHW
ncbi:alcohol dehydrogenase [Nocardioides gansuensis]|uniref:hydroxyacid-oxoacid transhydrogenase n=1 Tax=Nocardioides gansuensis TaxID=2138300 RepID=A0A2T8F6G8_9ACTN|nr:hydroxyacid-oxoacid transhydrogenase [Nocardioides gansuensis]PVG81306.1 alcohol dehydrogenase [Nocardioides gansuensis]